MSDHEQDRTQVTPDPSEPATSEVDRRTFLKGAGTLGAAALSGPFLSKPGPFSQQDAPAWQPRRSST